MKSWPEGVNYSNPSTISDDDPRTIKDVPDRPLRPDEFPIAERHNLTPDDLIVKDKLGMSEKWWDETKRQVLEKYGELMAEDHRIPRVLVTQEIYSYDFLDRAQRICVELAENSALPAQDRLDACEMIGYLADISSKKAKQLLEIGEKASKKTVDVKKRNLPPNATLVQVNVQGGTAKTKALPSPASSRTDPKHVQMATGQ